MWQRKLEHTEDSRDKTETGSADAEVLASGEKARIDTTSEQEESKPVRDYSE